MFGAYKAGKTKVINNNNVVIDFQKGRTLMSFRPVRLGKSGYQSKRGNNR